MLSAGVVVEARQQVHQGGLARAGRPEQGHRLSGLAVERDILEHASLPSVFELERNILEDDLAFHRLLRLNLAIR